MVESLNHSHFNNTTFKNPYSVSDLPPPPPPPPQSYFHQVMAAYAAAASLKNTIQRILQSSRISIVSHSPQIVPSADCGAATFLKNTIHRILQSFHISLFSHSPKILQPVYDQMNSLQKVLLKLDETSCSKIRTEVNAADELIKEAIWEFEDLLESHILPQILSQLGSERNNLSFSVDLQSLQHQVDCFVEMVKMMKVEYTKEMKNMAEEEGEPISSRIDSGGMIKSKMVGLSDEFQEARDDLLNGNDYSIIGGAL